MNAGSIYRILIALVILLPYKVYTMSNRIETSFLADFLVAMVAFGLGYLIFPIKPNKPGDKKKDDRVIDQEEK
jgi:hypothetical protein